MKLKFIIDKEYDLKIGRQNKFKEPFYSEVKKDYKLNKIVLEKTKKIFQKAWDEINNEFSKYIEKETGYKWFYPEYKCVISIAHEGGISNWGNEPKISYFWNNNPYLVTQGVAHELILSHYFEIIKRHYKNEKLKGGQIWGLAEIASIALMSLTKKSRELWPWYPEYPTRHNYPQIVYIQLKLKDKFIKRKNFNEYIKEGIKLIKKYPKINPFTPKV